DMVTGSNIKSGDMLIGLPSTGLHTNGYSLARASLLGRYSLEDHFDELNGTLAEALLAVHRSYLATIAAVLKKFEVKGLSHITGGGIVGNTRRIVPRGLSLHIDWTAWERPAIFKLIQRTGDVPEDDMRRTFNLGIGLILIVSKKKCDDVLEFVRKRGEQCVVVGDVVKAA
ncbi:MAG: AIR synthase-related protein, partial [Bacteroidota bacterium]